MKVDLSCLNSIWNLPFALISDDWLFLQTKHKNTPTKSKCVSITTLFESVDVLGVS